MKKRKLLIFLFFLILNFLPQIFVIISKPDNLMNWYLTDDAFYYFKTAQNIIEGKGITFDGLDPTNGFHPLWMIICIPIFALAKVNLFLPLRVVAVVQILLNAVSGFFLFELVEEKISKSIAWAAAMFWMFFPSIHGITTKLGLETGINACMLMLFLYLLSKIPWDRGEKIINKNLLWIGICGIGVLFSRLDNIFVLIFMGIWLIFKGKTINIISQIDFLIILISAVASFFIRLGSFENIFNYLNFLYLLIACSLIIKPLMLYFLHAYEINEKQDELFILKNSLFAITISSVFIFCVLYVLHDICHVFEGFPRTAVVIDWGISVVLIGLYRFLRLKMGRKNTGMLEDLSLKNNFGIWIKRAVWYFSPIIISLIAYLLINYQYAGTAMPVSGQIKRWWGTLPNTVYGQPERTLIGVIRSLFIPNRINGPYWMLTQPINGVAHFIEKILGISIGWNSLLKNSIICLISGVIIYLIFLLLKNSSKRYGDFYDNFPLLPLFIGMFFHAMIYKSTGYLHAKEWYWVGEMILSVLFYSFLIAAVIGLVKKRSSYKKYVSIFITLTCLIIWGKFSISIFRQFPLDGQVPFEYNLNGEIQFIRAETEPGDVIGMTGGGLIAYFVPNRTILNLDGLINSADYFSKLKDGKTADYLIDKKVKYIYGEELVLLDSDPYRWIFKDTLSAAVPGPYFLLYKYVPIKN